MSRYSYSEFKEASTLADNTSSQSMMEVLSNASGAEDVLETIGVEGRSLLTPSIVYDAFTKGRSKSRLFFEQFIEVVAEPGCKPRRPIQPGDFIVRVGLAEPGIAHLSIITTGKLMNPDNLRAKGVTPESDLAGWYAIVDSRGIRSRTGTRPFAELILNETGFVPYDQVILRLKQPSDFNAEEVDADSELSEEISADHDSPDIELTDLPHSQQPLAVLPPAGLPPSRYVSTDEYPDIDIFPEGDLTTNFSLSEFSSRGTPVPAQYLSNVRQLAENLQVLRNHIGAAITIISGYRTPEHNNSVGGASQSQHLTASAADMRIPGLTPSQVYCTIEELIEQGSMRQGGLGIYTNFVHYDIRGSRARWVGRGASAPDCQGVSSQPRQASLTTVVQDTPNGPFGILSIQSPAHLSFNYPFTSEDVLWIARFLVGEAGGRDNRDNRAIIWTMFNRFAYRTRTRYPTFHEFLRAYSTPLQPVLRNSAAARRHMHNPDFQRTGGNYQGTSIPRGQLGRHLSLQRRPWGELPSAARSLAERAVRGEIPNPIGNATEFGSTRIYFRDRHGRFPRDEDEWRQFTENFARSKQWVWVGPVEGLNQSRGNAFFVEERLRNLPPGTVQVSQPGVSVTQTATMQPPVSPPPQECYHFGAEPEQYNWWDTEVMLESLLENVPSELRPLLEYLGISYATFAPIEGQYFQTLTEHLRRQGIIGGSDSINRTNFQDAIRRFQSSRGQTTPDGIPGENTLWELQVDWANNRNLSIQRVEADKVAGSGGFEHFRLREDAATSYNNLRQDVLNAGGVITSAGSFRGLGAEVTAARSATSMHYSGLALDLATDTGMRNTSSNPYLITQEGRKWRVWCRSQTANERTIDAVIWSNGRTRIEQVTAQMFDFTAMCERHGFISIGPRRTFPSNYLSAEWWHFQYERALTPYISQFGIELLSLAQYNEGTLSRTGNIWANRKRIFKRVRHGWY